MRSGQWQSQPMGTVASCERWSAMTWPQSDKPRPAVRTTEPQ